MLIPLAPGHLGKIKLPIFPRVGTSMLDGFNSGASLKPPDELFTVQKVQASATVLMTVRNLASVKGRLVTESMTSLPK